MTLGKYLEASSAAGIYTALNPINRVATSTTRSWTDSNRNFVADCDLLNPALQNLTASGGDICGQWANLNFGKNVVRAPPTIPASPTGLGRAAL